MTPEENHKRFADVLHDIQKVFPDPLEVSCGKFSPQTVAARLREARNFAQLYHIVIRVVDGKVIAGSEEKTKRTAEPVNISALPKIIDAKDPLVLNAIATLMKAGILHGPLLCRVGDAWSPAVNQLLEETYSIAVEDNKDGTYTLL